jgi:hypothetical protein
MNLFSLGKKKKLFPKIKFPFLLYSHADGSIKFWDASGCNLVFLYKLRTNRLFDRIQSSNPNPPVASSNNSNSKEINSNIKYDTKTTRANSNTNDEQQILLNEDNPFSIYTIKICCEGKYLIAAARGGHVTLFKFTGSELEKADEGLGDLSCLEVPIFHRNISSDQSDANNEIQTGTTRQNLDKKVKDFISIELNYQEYFVGI